MRNFFILPDSLALIDIEKYTAHMIHKNEMKEAHTSLLLSYLLRSVKKILTIQILAPILCTEFIFICFDLTKEEKFVPAFVSNVSC